MNKITQTLRAFVVAVAIMPVGEPAFADDLVGPPAQSSVQAKPAPSTPAPAAEPVAPAAVPEREKLKLGKPVELVKNDAASAATPAGAGILRTAGSLGLVLLLAVGLAWGFKKIAARNGGLAAMVGAGGKAPSGILSILGRYPLGRGQTLILLKLDRRVLLVAQTRFGRWGSQANLSTLSEITDAAEVASIVAKAGEADGSTPAAKFERELARADRAGELVPEPPIARPRARTPAAPSPAQTQDSAAVADLKRKLAALRIANAPAVRVAGADRTSRGVA